MRIIHYSLKNGLRTYVMTCRDDEYAMICRNLHMTGFIVRHVR